MNLDQRKKFDKMMGLMESISSEEADQISSDVQSKHLGYDGKLYAIVQEGANYVLKYTDKPNCVLGEDFDYINGLQNKPKYTRKSYTEIHKLYNLINIENSNTYGDKLIKEAIEEQKFVIPVKKKTNTVDTQPPAEDDFPEGGFEDSVEDFEDTEGGESSMGDEPSEDPEDYKDVDPDDIEEDGEKAIQKLAGKLSYELRSYDDEDKYSDTAKFAMSMATSALQTDKMSDSDKNDIEKKVQNKLDSEETSDEITDEPEDVEEKGMEDMEEPKMESMYESVVFSKSKFVSLLNEGRLIESIDPLKTWAIRLSHKFNTGEIKSTEELLKIISNNIDTHGVTVDEYELRKNLESELKGSKITPRQIINTFNKTIESPQFDDEKNIFFEEEDEEDIHGVDKDDILFDLDEDFEYYKENGGKFKNVLDLESLKAKIDEYSKEENKTNNYEKNLRRFVSLSEEILRRLDHKLSYAIDKVQSYDGVETQSLFITDINESLKSIELLEHYLKTIKNYKNNFWMKRYKDEGRDPMALELVDMIDQRYIDFQAAKEYYNKQLLDLNNKFGTKFKLPQLYKSNDESVGSEELEEEVFTEPIPEPKNKKYAQKYPGVGWIGRLEGDDDAVKEPAKFKQRKNPFLYKK